MLTTVFLASQPKKRASTGRLKGPVSNGNVGQHKVLTNGTHGSMSDLNRQESEEDPESINHDGDLIELNTHIKGEEKELYITKTSCIILKVRS